MGVLKKHGMEDAASVPTPAIKEKIVRMAASAQEKNRKEQRAYTKYMQSAVGDLLYLTSTRPDISFAVNQLSLMTNDTQHETGKRMVKRVLRYLRGNDKGLVYERKNGLELMAASDADHAGDVASRKSQMGVAVFIGGCPIEATSRQQSTIAISVFESELIASSEAARSVIFVDQYFQQLGIAVQKPVPLLIDNKSVCDVAATGKKTHRTRHIGVRHFFIREKVEEGLIKTWKTTSNEQPADGLTKALSGDEFDRFCDYFIVDI